MIPDDVQKLIASSIPSSAGLHALLLLHRSPDTYWTPGAVAAAIEATPEDVAEAMVRMEATGLLERATATVAFRYNPGETVLQAAADHLVTAFHRNRYAVLDALRGVPASVRAFSDAFRQDKD